jgi:hypothetical protein
LFVRRHLEHFTRRNAGSKREYADSERDFLSKKRKIDIQVVDVHEVKDGKIIRTWHTEDWMIGLRHLGVFEK